MNNSERFGNLDQLQKHVYAEFARRWPENTIVTEGLALAEEAGEVCRAILKRLEGTRGTPEEWTANLRKEIGQAMLVLLNLAALEEADASDVLVEAWEGFRDKPDTEPMGIADELERILMEPLRPIEPLPPDWPCRCPCHEPGAWASHYGGTCCERQDDKPAGSYGPAVKYGPKIHATPEYVGQHNEIAEALQPTPEEIAALDRGYARMIEESDAEPF